MDKFNIEMENDNELTDLLWVNYLENRDFREISAKKKWNELFNGSVENYSDLKLIGMNSLNRFKEFTIGNEKFCTQLIKKYCNYSGIPLGCHIFFIFPLFLFYIF